MKTLTIKKDKMSKVLFWKVAMSFHAVFVDGKATSNQQWVVGMVLCAVVLIPFGCYVSTHLNNFR